jgi:hypothetical protein
MTAFEMSNQNLAVLKLHLESKKSGVRLHFPSASLCLSLLLFSAVERFYVSEGPQLGIFSSVCEGYSCSQHLLYIYSSTIYLYHLEQ